MTLKIERISSRQGTRIALSGELRFARIDDVRAEIAQAAQPVTLDLKEVDLVDIDTVRWLNACQSEGVRVEHCAPYIREWMHQEKSGDES